MRKGWLDGPFPFAVEGKLVTGLGLQLVNPATKFGGQQVGELRAVDVVERSRTDPAAAVRTPVNPPTWGQFAAFFRTFRDAGIPDCLAMARAVRSGAY